MNRFIVAAGSVAAVVLIAVVGFGLVSGGGGVGSTAPSPSPTPSAAPTQAVRELAEGVVEPGRYSGEGQGFRYTFTVPDGGWTAGIGDLCCMLYQGEDSEVAILAFNENLDRLYRRACQSVGTEFTPGPSVGALADALASLEDFETTTPADVIVSGYQGKQVSLTVPMDVADPNSSACDLHGYDLSDGRWYQAAGQKDTYSILDVDGERLVLLSSYTPDTPADIKDQLDAMFASLEVEPIAP